MTYSWAPAGERKRVPYENPRGRRVNVLAVYAPYGPERELLMVARPRTLTAEDVIAFLLSLARPGRPATVVLDNGSIHVSHQLKDALPWLARKGIRWCYLPAYSPELNDIERVFRRIKHLEMPERTYFTTEELSAAVHKAFDKVAAGLNAATGTYLLEAA